MLLALGCGALIFSVRDYDWKGHLIGTDAKPQEKEVLAPADTIAARDSIVALDKVKSAQDTIFTGVRNNMSVRQK